MPPLTLDGNTLGEKHKHFNKIVQNAIENKQINLSKINSNDNDIENLLKIDVASKTKNVEYIIEVLKCDDMLYVSRAIKQSKWLITEKQYEHIINPEYLYTELFPYMLTKAVNKLLLQIRLHLKDEKRIESFYTYIKHIDNGNNGNDAKNWLWNCSIPFIESVIQKEKHISLKIYKRLCKRSVNFLQYYAKVDIWCPIINVLFLLKSNVDKFLNVLDVFSLEHHLPQLSKKYTEIVMKHCPSRIIHNYDNYIGFTDPAIVAKYLKKGEIKDFLIKYLKNDKTKRYLRNYDYLRHFIKNMPQEDKFEFVRKTYIDKNYTALVAATTEDVMWHTAITDIPSCDVNMYRWYELAPFPVAFVELKKLIRTERSPIERCAMLSVLITCARKHPQNINILLQHYYDKHRNEPFKFKIQFVNNVIKQLATYEFNQETWNILDTLFQTLEIYMESDNNVQSCLQAIILYKVLHDETVPDIVEKKFQFDTLKKFQHKFNEVQQNKVFTYLLNFISTKINNNIIATELDLENAVSLMENVLNLISDWNKSIENYEFIPNKIRELLLIRKQNLWKTNFSSLYNIKKSYRRYMFQESILLYPCENVLINALKHEPELLTRYSEVVDTLRGDDTVSLTLLLAKLRVYWPYSFAQEWIGKYLKQIDMNTGHRATIRGLFILLPQSQLIDITKKYIPEHPKINWSEIDQTKFSVQKNIAKYLYKARPLIDLDVVLWYAKGDYLQYSVPSISAISHNISKKKTCYYVSKLLNAPVSLQKYGLHLAFIKLKHDELKPIFSNIWKGTLNATIRTHIFVYTYKLLCRMKDSTLALELWELLSEFIENMATEENKIIFSKLGNVKKVPTCVQGQFYMKSYKYLTSLPPSANAENSVKSLFNYAPHIMDILDEDFVVDKLLSPITATTSKRTREYIDIMSSFVLFGKTEEEQCERFRRVVVPGLAHVFQSWNVVKDNEYIFKEDFNSLLQALIWDLKKNLYLKKIVVPVKMFTEIKILMEQNLSPNENYLTYTCWTLTCEYIKLVAEHKDMFYDPKLNVMSTWTHQYCLPQEAEQVWEAVHIKISPSMGSIIVKLLKEDTKKYFTTICWLFSAALDDFFNNVVLPRTLLKMETLKYMIVNEDFIPSYLVVCNLLPSYGNDEERKKRLEICEILSAHPSLEVKMHYHKALGMVA